MITESRQDIQTLTAFERFKADIKEGLTSENKFLPSRYFYDNTGSEIFRKIMKLPEYYLTRCEYSILEGQKDQILENINFKEGFDLIEFGAGDGYKTYVLLEYFINHNIEFEYIPVDISEESNLKLYRRLKSRLPSLNISPISEEYFRAMDILAFSGKRPKVLLFLGSNVGNFTRDEAITFFKSLGLRMTSGDKLLIGFDMKKKPSLILDAYNDKQGVTRDFNLNLLHRLNRELEADFDLQQFMHAPVYDPLSGAARSYLISLCNQDVYLKSLDLLISFNAWEAISTEVSQKYDQQMIREMAAGSGFKIVRYFFDEQNYYVDALWEKE